MKNILSLWRAARSAFGAGAAAPLLVLALALSWAGPGADAALAAQTVKKGTQQAPAKGAQRAPAKEAPQAPATVYDRQPPVTDKELLNFLEVLPQFRAWAKAGNEEAHPILRNDKADFLYSPQAAAWVQAKGWNPVRFFCVMGRMAAALAIVEEGNDMRGERARDMPEITDADLALARRHLGSMLKAGGDVPPISR